MMIRIADAMPANWNTSGLIIEGIPATGKTTLLKALQQDAAYAGKTYPSSFILSEHHTQRVLEERDVPVASLPPSTYQQRIRQLRFPGCAA